MNKIVQLRLKGARDVGYSLRFVSPGNGSSLEEWIRMGKPDWPTREQIAALIESSKIPATSTRRVSEPVRLAPDELALVELY